MGRFQEEEPIPSLFPLTGKIFPGNNKRVASLRRRSILKEEGVFPETIALEVLHQGEGQKRSKKRPPVLKAEANEIANSERKEPTKR
jgi:hypothetical protein